MSNSKNKSNFGTRLLSMLKQHELSLREAAEIAGVAHTVLHDWTIGTTPSNFAAVKRLAQHFGTSFEWLLLGEDAADGPAWRGVIEDGEELYNGIFVIEGRIRQLKPRK